MKQILDIAAREIGTVESPPNSNLQKYGAVFGLNGYAWCAMFVWWCFNKAGAANLLPRKTASCSQLMRDAKAAGLWVTSGFRPGDVLIYNFGTSQKPQYHTGILEAVSDQTYTAIEGNTSYGNDRNGGSVMRRNRYSKTIVGAVRPKYDADLKPVQLVAQEVLDGKWGNGDTRREKLAAAGYNPAEVQDIVNRLSRGNLRVQVTASTLNIRERPDLSAKKLDVFGRGAMVYVEEIREGPGASCWGRVGTGWISMDWAKVI